MKLEALVRVRVLSCLIHPSLRRHGPLQVVSELVGSIWTFGFTAVEPALFRVVGMDTSSLCTLTALTSPTIKLEWLVTLRQ